MDWTCKSKMDDLKPCEGLETPFHIPSLDENQKCKNSGRR